MFLDMNPIDLVHKVLMFIKKASIVLGGSVLGYLLNFVMPIREFLVIVGVLVLVDLYLGTRAAKKRGDKITGDGIAKTVNKTKNYFIAILVTEGVRSVFFKGSLNITFVISAIIAVAEYYSIIGHISEMTGLDILTLMKEYIGDRIKLRIKTGGKDEPVNNTTTIDVDSTVNNPQ